MAIEFDLEHEPIDTEDEGIGYETEDFTMSNLNCIDWCPYVNGGECNGECMTIKPKEQIEILSDEDIECGASKNLVVVDEPVLNGNW